MWVGATHLAEEGVEQRALGAGDIGLRLLNGHATTVAGTGEQHHPPRTQFLAESLLLTVLGGIAGRALGALVSLGDAASRGWQPAVPPAAVVGGIAAALVIGATAGLYPAMRAARPAPTDALRTV